MLRPLLLVLALALSLAAWRSAPPQAKANADRAWSAQLHVHGSFSEGVGSIDSHSFEASDVGVDVIWWSDHDFRIATWRHVSTFSFDREREPLDHDEDWTAWTERERRSEVWLDPSGPRHSLPDGRVTYDARDPFEGEASLRVEGSHAGEDFDDQSFAVRCDRALIQRSLAAEVTLEIALDVEELGPDAEAFVQVALSEHPRTDREGGFRDAKLRYVFTNERDEPWLEGAVHCIPVPFEPGGWQRHALALTRDAVAAYPASPGEDNALGETTFGIRARRGARAAVRFDALRVSQERTGGAIFRRQAELIEEIAARYPAMRQHQGVELSAASMHLNEFSADTQLLNHDRIVRDGELLHGDPPTLDQREYAGYLTSRVVPAIQARGGLVSFNHMFGTDAAGDPAKAPREQTLERLIANRAGGADLLEVGYRDRGGHPLEDHLWVWDRLAEADLPFVGIGVSDSHGGRKARWRTGPNNLVSWIFAPTPEKVDLIRGLRAGRTYFGDRTLFDGELDVVSRRGFRMGQVVITDRPAAEVELHVDGLKKGDVVRVVESGGPTELRPAEGAEHRAAHRLELPDDGGLVRFEVRTADGVAKVFSNPIWYERELPAGVDATRLGIDLAGLRVRALEGFDVRSVEIVEADGGRELHLTGEAAAGSLEVLCEGRAPVVRFAGPSGRVEAVEGRARVEGLDGAGTVILR